MCQYILHRLTLIHCIVSCSAGPRSAVGRKPDSYVRGPGFDTRSDHILSFLLPLIQRRALVSYWRKYVHEVLVKRLRGLSLPRKSVVRLTDRPDMTSDVYNNTTTTTMYPVVIACIFLDFLLHRYEFSLTSK